jgi:hypothetical protein
MPRLFTKLASLALLTLAGQSSWGFALLGPNNEAYQVPEIGYNPLPRDPLLTGPKNLGEEYRRNTPVLFYSFDANFLDYFGSNGVAAVDSAFAIINNLTNVSQYSSNLSEFPTQVTRENYVAQSLAMLDLKSYALHIMVEQLGLAEPERYVWTLHDRNHVGPVPCPVGMQYSITKRNFDPVTSPLDQSQYSSYVNGTLYTYFVNEVCVSPPAPPFAEAVEFGVDPLDFTFTAVASFGSVLLNLNDSSVTAGGFYTGLTRDDVGGLRYLLSKQNVNFESTGPNTLAAVTNPVTQLLFTSNLTQFAAQALTNDAPTLLGLYPNLSILSSSNYFVNVLVTNFTPFFTNFPWAPAGTTVLLFATNVTPTIQTRFVHTFGNLLVVTHSPSGAPVLTPLTQIPAPNGKVSITIETDTVGLVSSPFAPAGTLTVTTNSTFSTFLTNAVVGDFVILPTNLCSIDILSTQLTFVTKATNSLGSFTNSLNITSTSGFTNAGTTLVFSQSEITYFTNHAFVILPVNCVASGAALFEGIERVSFVRRDFDSLLGRFFQPITNSYVLNSITNSALVPEPILRTVPAPDFVFSATDQATTPDSIPGAGAYARSINFNTTFAGLGLAGPGTIETTNTIIAFEKVGPIFANFSPQAYFLNSAEADQVFIPVVYGSFDGTTNPPIVYPNGTSILNMENQILIGISPGRLPNGQVGANFGDGTPVAFTATGGTPPYTWSLSPSSAGLPPGLHLLANGTIVGVPTQEGTFDFSISMTDGGGRTINRDYFITITP